MINGVYMYFSAYIYGITQYLKNNHGDVLWVNRIQFTNFISFGVVIVLYTAYSYNTYILWEHGCLSTIIMSYQTRCSENGSYISQLLPNKLGIERYLVPQCQRKTSNIYVYTCITHTRCMNEWWKWWSLLTRIKQVHVGLDDNPILPNLYCMSRGSTQP